MQSRLQRIAVIGAGSDGWRLAARTAQAGYSTIVEDLMPSNLRRAASGMRQTLSAAMPEDAIETVMARVSFAATIEEAVREADLALDCVPDELESKLEIFCLLDRMAPPRTILCTPTETLGIADIASCTYRADRCLAVRVPAASKSTALADATAVHVTHSHWTLPQALQSTVDFWRSLGMDVTEEMDASMIAAPTAARMEPAG